MKAILSLLFISVLSLAQGQNCIPNTNSLNFDGSSSYVDFGSPVPIDTLSGPVSIEAWIYSTAWGFNSAQNTILCTHGWTSGEQGMVLRAGGNGELSFNFAGLDSNSVPTSWVEVISPTNSIQLNTWTHVAGTFSGTELKVFVNGNEVASTSFTGSIVQSSYGANIGRLADANQFPGRFFSGNIDEVRVWNRDLSAAELSASASKHIDPTSAVGLVGYWRLNEGLGTAISDLGSGGNNGSNLNCNWSTDVPFNEVPPTPTVNWNGTTLICGLSQLIQWNLGGNPISGANATTYTPSQNGSYTVTHTSAAGCSLTSAPYLVGSVGVESIDAKESYKLWPNPTAQVLHIQSAFLNTDKTEVSLFDSNQRLVRREQFVPQGFNTMDIDVSSLSKGIYHLSVSGPQGVGNFKIIILR